MTVANPAEASSLFSGILTAVSITWALQASLVWRATQPDRPPRSLVFALITMTLLAGCAVGLSILGLHFVAVGIDTWVFEWTYWGTIAVSLAFTGLVVVYYLGTLGALLLKK